MEKLTREAVIKKIIEWFNDNEDVFTECIEELDCYNGYLGDDRYYWMEELDEFFVGMTPSEFLPRVYYGYDEDTSSEHNRTEFCPNRDFFRFNGYGNLVSADYKDYSAYNDSYAVEKMLENRRWIEEIEANEELDELFDLLENDDFDNEEEEDESVQD